MYGIYGISLSSEAGFLVKEVDRSSLSPLWQTERVFHSIVCLLASPYPAPAEIQLWAQRCPGSVSPLCNLALDCVTGVGQVQNLCMLWLPDAQFYLSHQVAAKTR